MEIAKDAFSMLCVAESNAITIADQIVRILQEDGEEYVKNCAAVVLSYIVVYKHDASILINSGAFPVLLKIVGDGEIGDYLKEKAMAIIGLSSCLKEHRDALVDAGVIPVTAEMLRNGGSRLLLRFASRLITNLYMDNDYFELVVDKFLFDVERDSD